MNPRTIVVAGASAAGISAAETLRRKGYDGRLVVVGDEPHLPYERPPLSKQALTGEWGVDRIAMRDAGALARSDLDLRLGVRAAGLDVGARKLTLDGGEILAFDGLVIATGVRPRTLADAAGLSGVHTLRTLDDLAALRESLRAGGRVSVIGSGPLGMEAAASLAQAGSHEVTVITDESNPMARVFGAEVGALLGRLHRGNGVAFRAGRTVTGLVGVGGRVSAVRLADGTTVPADTVLIAIGAVPNTEWLDGSGICTGLGIACDPFSAAAPGVYAAGDVAHWHHGVHGERVRVEHRSNATEQGAAAAHNLLSELRVTAEPRSAYTPVPWFWSDQYALKLQAYGILQGADRVEMPYRDLGDPDRPRAVAFYLRQGVVKGVLGTGVPPRVLRELRALVALPRPWEDVRGQADDVLAPLGRF
ncbi:FAD-dependent oxidoreductase [Streptomyces sp. NPDC004232]|uniref:NAD(P)/FAD-dependent oxidoreductase n=1 Tax=Streptomyces sp. NPDC004232 TaxID=3154454 RepID=UPI001D912B1B|nr:FAD-dependent oxidoreductase [Streptomyces sp. tea 10]